MIKTILLYIKCYKAATHVDCFSLNNNGRLAFLNLLSIYKGSVAWQTIMQQARKVINTTYYQKDLSNFNFDNYCNRHIAAQNNLLTLEPEYAMDGKSQVTAFLEVYST